MRTVAALFRLGTCLFLLLNLASPQESQTDSDNDGLSDEVEQALLERFAPRFMIDRSDCSGSPVEFQQGLATPEAGSGDNAIYGQAFPAKALGSTELPTVEIHFYHLWKTDCGAHGHALDAEHVSVLVRASAVDLSSASWKAVYWFAAAHENTVCDVSQIARASTLRAEDHGATVWISAGKHASFLNEKLCRSGCGNDICGNMKPLSIRTTINLGEPGKPMNGAVWAISPQWRLAVQMAKSDFPQEAIGRLAELPSTDIAWFNPGRHPAQGVIAVSSSTAAALGNSTENTATAISVAGDSTGNALQKSYQNTVKALGTSVTHVGKFLHIK